MQQSRRPLTKRGGIFSCLQLAIAFFPRQKPPTKCTVDFSAKLTHKMCALNLNLGDKIEKNDARQKSEKSTVQMMSSNEWASHSGFFL